MNTLKDLNVGESCVIKKNLTSGSMQRRFIDIGLIENTVVKCVGKSPAGDPKAYLIRGAVIAIRNDDCNKIYVTLCDEGEAKWD